MSLMQGVNVSFSLVFRERGKALNVGEHDRQNGGIVFFAVIVDVREFTVRQVKSYSRITFYHIKTSRDRFEEITYIHHRIARFS